MALWSAPAHAVSQAGELDPGFGEGGKVLTPVGSGADRIEAMAIDGQGRIVVAGRSLRPGERYIGDFAVARYTAAGELDLSFGGDGTVVTQVGPSGSTANAVAIDADGRVIVGGMAEGPDGSGDFAVARYDAVGHLDESFGDGGIVTTPVGDEEDAIEALAMDRAGRIVAGGSSVSGLFHTSDYFVLARYRHDGGLDSTFGGDGTVVDAFGSQSIFGGFRSLAIDPDGRIVGGGSAGSLPHTDTLVARYDESGEPDPSFDGDGEAMVTFGDFSGANGTAIDSQGRIVTAGSSWDSEAGSHLSLARFLPDGSLDPSFGEGGKALTLVGSSGADAVAIDGGGRIVAAGALPYAIDEESDFAVFRYRPDGALDGTFGYGGVAATSFGGDDDATSVAIVGENRIVVAGSADNGSDTEFALARYLGESDTRAPVLQVSGAERQPLTRKVKVRVACDEQCVVEAGGRVTVGGDAGRREVRRLRLALKPASAELGAGEAAVLRPKLTRRELRRIKRKLSRTEATAHAKLTVRATDDAGNEGAARRTVRLRP